MFKVFMKVVGIVLALSIIIGITSFVGKMLMKPIDVIETVTQTDKIIHNYEYFYNQAEAYMAIKSKIRAANGVVYRFKEEAGPRKDWTFEDKTESSRLSSIADGLVYQCEDLVADYNAKAQQMTRKFFKSDETPYQLGACK